MQCPHCQQPLTEPHPELCPTCGKALASPEAAAQEMAAAAQAGTTVPVGVTAAQAAEQVKQFATGVATGLKRTLDDPNLLERIPGRSVSIAGLGFVALAILLSITPWFYGVGWFWSIIMLLGGAAVAVQELQLAGVKIAPVDQAVGQLPASLRTYILHPLVPPIYAALTLVHAFQLARFGIAPLLWVAAAGLLCYDQYRKTILAPNSFGHYFDLRRAWHGYRRYIILGAALCFLSLLMTWGKQTGGFMGGFTSSYSSYHGEYVSSWDSTKYYYAGWEFTGRSQGFVEFVEIALLCLVVWSAFRGNLKLPAWSKFISLGLSGFLGLWWVWHINNQSGVWFFFLGLAMIGFAVTMLFRGQDAGPYDMEALMARVRTAK